MRGFKASEETRRLMSSMRQGVNAPTYGLHMSDAAKSSISKKLTGRTFSSSTRSLMSRAKRKPVYQYTLAGDFVAQYESASEASVATGTNRGNLCACCRRVVTSANGYFWSYAPIDSPRIVVDHLTGVCPLPIIRQRATQPVICMDHDGNMLHHYSSIKEASDAVGYAAQHISYACKHPNAVTGPYKWRYYDNTTSSHYADSSQSESECEQNI